MEGRAERHWQAWRRLPATFTIHRPDLRPCVTDEERQRITGLLDAAVAEGIEVVQTRAVRAAFRLDEGDPRGAAEDMRAVADVVGTPYARAVADAFDALPEDARSSSEIDLSAAPEPQSAEDHYIAGYHAMREFQFASALEHLGHEGLASNRHAQELSCRLMIGKGGDLQERVLDLESAGRGRSTTSAHLLGWEYVVRKDYVSSLRMIHEGLELDPDCFPLHENAAVAALRIRDVDGSIGHYEAMIRIRPHYDKPYFFLLKLYVDNGDFEAALETLERFPLEDAWDTTFEGLFLYAEIESARAMDAWLQGDREGAREAAQEALDSSSAAHELMEHDGSTYVQIARAILADDPAAAVASLFERAAGQPTNDQLIDKVVRWLEATDGNPDRVSVVRFLEALRASLREQFIVDERIDRKLRTWAYESE